MPTKTKILVVSCLILFGASLFAYCAVFYPTQSAVSHVVDRVVDQAEPQEAPQICESTEPPVQETAISNPEPTPATPKPEPATPTPSPSKPRPRAAAT